MARDDFSNSVKQSLAKRTGYRCSNPECRAMTAGPQNEGEGVVNIGVAAHITAASPGGPRYDPSLTKQERSSIRNGIWLCSNCSVLVDRDPETYPVAKLQEWKAEAERIAASEIGQSNLNNKQAGFFGVEMTVSPRNVPPFAFAFTGDIPAQLLSAYWRDIPFDDVVWVDRAPLKLTLCNRGNTELIVTDISIDCSPLDISPNSGLQFTKEGACNSIEFVFELDKDSPHPVMLERRQGRREVTEDFFEDGGYISVKPGCTEPILLSFVAPLKPVEVKVVITMFAEGEFREVVPDGLEAIRIVPAASVPEGRRIWRIHLDGRARGNGFPQSMIEEFRPKLIEKLASYRAEPSS